MEMCTLAYTKVQERRHVKLLHHPNIVRLKGILFQPLAMMLKYVYFDFNHFGCDGVSVHSLSDFLLQIDEFNCEGLCELVNHAAKEIVNELAHLHSKGIAHRDHTDKQSALLYIVRQQRNPTAI